MFRAILDIKYANKVQKKKKKDYFQNSAKDRMTHFKILFSQKITEIVMVGKNFSQVNKRKH